MLHVFLVDIGIMLKFDMELAVESVACLMEAVYQKVFIPPNKQVLLSANGSPLSPSNRVASYASCGTETQPIYLFCKSTIESPVPPSPSMNLGSEASLKEEVEKSLKMKPQYETLVSRAKLAAEFQKLALEIGENCESVVNDQFLQSNGWRAVVLNLDQITCAFEQHLNVFEEYYQRFLVARLQYSQMIQKYDQVVLLLQELPLLKCLSITTESANSMSLLEWISSHDKQSSVKNLVKQCQEALQKCNEAALEEIVHEAHKVLDSVHNVGMKEIKGLSERLDSLQQRLRIARQLIQDQIDMSQGFQQNQKRAEHVGDMSVLPDLCASHQRQLIVLLKNHHQIREIRNLCVRAKDELSTNLHARLRWVMYIEKSIFECDSKLMVYHESLKRIKKRLDIFEQVFEAPKMYVLAVLEVLRRKNFSAQFLEWSKSVSQSSTSARTEELKKRKMFHEVFGNHFVKNLFPGLEHQPQPFAEEPIQSCDDILPDISVQDIRLLQGTAPDLMAELHMGDPLESSTVVRDCLSQSNLTKLVDPRQNKTLEETMHFREKALVDNNQLTMSVLKREMSCNDVGDFPFPNDVNFSRGAVAAGGGSSHDRIIDNDDDEEEFSETTFEPASLQSLSREKIMTTSSESEALFHSAELDFVGASSSAVSSPPTSTKSSSGKSSSSPITIKGSRPKYRASYSLSPESEHVLREEVFSLPNITKGSISSITQLSPRVEDDVKDSSQNSCRSLSEAIKASEVDKCLNTSSELVQNLLKEIKFLKQELSDLRQTAHTFQQVTINEEFQDIKTKIIETCQSKEKELGDIRQKLCTCSEQNRELELKLKSDLARFQENAEKNRIEHEKEVTDIQHLLTMEKEDVENKYKTNISNLEERIQELENENEHLNIQLQEDEKKYESLQQESKDFKRLFDKRKEDYKSDKEKLQNEIIKLTDNLNSKNLENTDLKTTNEKLVEELNELKKSLDNLSSEKETLNDQLEQLSDSSQQSIDQHLSHVSSVTIKHKELKKLLAEKEQELAVALQIKDSLEAQKQNNFNAVFNKIKKDKDNQIKEMAQKISTLEKEVANQRNRNDALNKEIDVHKQAYNTLEGDMKKLQEKNQILEDTLQTEKLEAAKLWKENETLSNNVNTLNRSIEDIKAEKLKVIQELKTQYDSELEKEKSALLLACEVEKETALEQYGKSEHVLRMSSSIEEGIDMLEIDHMLEKIKNLEAENERLKSIEATASPKAQKVVRSTGVKPVEKITLRDLDVGSLILLCFDDMTRQYCALTLTTDKYFLHPDSLKEITGGRASDGRQWMFAFITAKELCVAKKASNKFNLPINTYFSRIHVRLYDK